MLHFLIVGLDIGTSYSAITIWHNGQLRTIHIPGNGAKLASAIFWPKDSKPIVGASALRSAIVSPEDLYVHFKRSLPTAPHDPVDGKSGPTPVELTAEIIKTLIRVAIISEPQLKPYFEKGGEQEGLIVAVAHPVDWGTEPLDALRDAGRLAGIEINAFVPEPVAVAKRIVDENGTRIQSGKKVFLVDVGGGTTDITLQTAAVQSFDTVVSGGDSWLGGANITGELFRSLAKEVSQAELASLFDDKRGLQLSQGRDPAQNRAALAIWRAAEEAKQHLSTEDEAQVFLETSSGPEQLTITGEQYDGLLTSFWERFGTAIDTTMAGTQYQWSDIDHVLLGGGSAISRGMAAQVAQATERSVEDVLLSTDSDHVVSSGVVLYLRDNEGSDANLPRGLGFNVRSSSNSATRINKFFVPSGAIVPASGLVVKDHGQCVESSNGGKARLALQLVEAKHGAIAPPPEKGVPSLLDDEQVVFLQRVEADVDLPPGRHDVSVTLTVNRGIPRYHLRFPSLPNLEPITGAFTTDTDDGDNRQPQAVDLLFLLDTSGSMEGASLHEAKESLRKIIANTKGGDFRYCLISFGAKTGVLNPLGESVKKIKSEVHQLQAGGTTPMTKALNCATDQMRRFAREGARVVSFVISDGYPDELQEAIDAAEVHKSKAELICVGVGDGVGEEYLAKIASPEKYFFAAQAADISIVTDSVLELILKEN